MTTGVAIVGLGVGQDHLRAYVETGRCQIRWLCDHDAEKARTIAAVVAGGVQVGSFDQILADGAVRIVSIASFDQDHAAQVEAALLAGKHVFVEKPLCRTHDELLRIRDAWVARGRRPKLASNLVLRAAPLYRWLKGAIEAGELGRLYAVDGDYLYGRIEKIVSGWRGEVPDYSVMLGGGIHLADLMLWLSRERPASAWAAGNRIATEGSGFGREDFAAATLRFPSGLVGRLTANFGCVHRHQHVLRVFGTEATFIYDDEGARLHRGRDGTEARRIDLDPLPPSKGALVPDFVAAVEEDRDLAERTREVFDAVSLCLACDRALRSGTATEVAYV